MYECVAHGIEKSYNLHQNKRRRLNKQNARMKQKKEETEKKEQNGQRQTSLVAVIRHFFITHFPLVERLRIWHLADLQQRVIYRSQH